MLTANAKKVFIAGRSSHAYQEGMMQDLVIGGLYVHYKNNRYRVLGVCRHSETLEELVYYECLYPNKLGQLWVRPKEMFLGDVETADYKGPRFRFVRDESLV